MRFGLVALLGLGLIPVASGQQPMRVPNVAGHPFSADQVIPAFPPNSKTIAPSIQRVHRDSAGRTRIDAPVPRVPASVPIVFINDPVGGMTYSLNMDTKIARRYSYPPVPAVPTTADPWKATLRFFGEPEPSRVEPLGTQLIGGLMVEGRKTTTIFPETEHRVAYENVVESWYSPDLQMMVLKQVHTTAYTDSVTRLENIDRSEPDPLLFRPPSDYTIIDPSPAPAEKRSTGPPVPPMPPFEFPKLPPPPAK